MSTIDGIAVKCAACGELWSDMHTCGGWTRAQAPKVVVYGRRSGKTADMTAEVLERLSDDQLCAECERRGIAVDGVGEGHKERAERWERVANESQHQRDTWKVHFERAVKERDAALAEHRKTADEWKRRAEAAEERAGLLERRIEGGYLPHIAMLQREKYAERGPGIAAKPVEGHWVDPWDFLEDE